MNYIEEKALVSDVDGEFIFLVRETNSSCNKCSSGKGCGNLDSIFNFRVKSRLKLDNTLNLKKGDTVVISIPSLSILTSAVLIYLLPLLSLLVLSLSTKIFFSENLSILSGLIGFLLSLALVSKLSRKSMITIFLYCKCTYIILL